MGCTARQDSQSDTLQQSLQAKGGPHHVLCFMQRYFSQHVYAQVSQDHTATQVLKTAAQWTPRHLFY
jgi:hypothetical protein